MKNKLSLMPTSLARVALLAASVLLAASIVNVYAAAFTAGNIVVYRVGSGTGNEVKTGNPVFLDEYTTGGTLVQSVAMPTTKSGSQYPLIASGTATSEGMLTRSSDGRYLIATGYGTNTGGSISLSGTTTANVPRVIGRVDSSGNIDTSTALADWTSGNNPRCAASVDGSAFWGAGGAGLIYATFGSTSSSALTNANGRVVVISGNQLYLSGAAASARNISTVGNGMPTSGRQTLTGLSGVTNSSPYGFSFFTLNGGAGPDTLYVADDNINGIVKYSLVGSTWTIVGTITASNVRGLVGVISGTTVTLYGTTGGSGSTGGGSIYTVTDTAGYNAAPSTTTVTTIATAAANTAFRGIAFAPISLPEASPATYSRNVGTPLLISITNLLANYTSVANGSMNHLTSIGTPSAGTASISADGKWILYTPNSLDLTSSDSFNYTVNDGSGLSASSTVTVNVAPNTSTGSAGTVDASNYPTSVGVTMRGIPNYYYDVQRATDVNFTQNLTTLVTAQPASSSGVVSFTDNSPPSPSAFYRLIYNHQ